MIPRHLHSVVLISLLGILSGCCLFQPARELPPPIPPGQENAEFSAEEISQIITERAEQFQNLQGLGKVNIQSWEERYKFSEVFVLSKPANFRLETLGFLDQPVIFLTSNQHILMLYSKKQNELYRGIATRENLFTLSGINLSVEDTIQVLSGNPPILQHVNSEWGLPLPDIQSYYLERVSLNQNTVQRIWFNTALQVISHLQEYQLSSGEKLLEVQFGDYRAETGMYPVPALIMIDRPVDNTRVEIKYKFFDVNQPLDKNIFTFTPPADAKVYYIEDATSGKRLERLAPFEEFRSTDDTDEDTEEQE